MLQGVVFGRGGVEDHTGGAQLCRRLWIPFEAEDSPLLQSVERKGAGIPYGKHIMKDTVIGGIFPNRINLAGSITSFYHLYNILRTRSDSYQLAGERRRDPGGFALEPGAGKKGKEKEGQA